jgi:acetylornithine deacetylase/succinyl-diaminopimelate desuccinylase-like protein
MRKSIRKYSWRTAVAALMVLTIACATRRPASARTAGNEMESLQKEIVSKLTGGSEIRPGVKLADRHTLENRREARVFLAGLLKRFGLEHQKQTYSEEGENVYAVLSCGRPSAETIVLGAHYDGVIGSPAANDDATGVAAVAAVAQRLRRDSQRSRDIIFVFFDEEEVGFKGSEAFAKMLKEENRPVHSVHTVDQMGWDQDGDRAIELEIPYDGALDLYQKAAADLKRNIPIYTTTEAGSDHSSFRQSGYRAVGITEEYRHKDTTPWMHGPGDTFDTINFDYLRSTTDLIAQAMDALTR